MIQVRKRSVTFIPPGNAKHLIGDFSDWDKKPIAVDGPLTLEFPEGAYIEYAFLDSQGKPFADPDNPLKAQNPWWSYPRAIELPGFKTQETPHPAKTPEVRRHRMESKALAATRRYYVCEPSRPAEAMVLVQDGVAYYRTANLHLVATALEELGEIVPLRLVFIEPEDRQSEYWFNPGYEAFMLEELLPELERTYGDVTIKALWGASLGGLVSAWLALKHPKLFPKIAMQSACLTADPSGGDPYRDPEWLTSAYAANEKLPLRFYLETGQIEWLLAPNRRFAAMLADRGYPHAYHERPSGHNWMTWRQGLAPALRFLFGTWH